LTGEILAEAEELITKEKAIEIEQHGVKEAYVHADGEHEVKIISNQMVEISDFIPDGFEISKEELDNNGINEKVRFSVLQEILSSDLMIKRLSLQFSMNAVRTLSRGTLLLTIFLHQ
jgi:DNA-directed RNA polymerase subunit beta